MKKQKSLHALLYLYSDWKQKEHCGSQKEKEQIIISSNSLQHEDWHKPSR